MEKQLSDKVALITGSDSGIGQAIAIAFAQEGAKVAVTYHSDEEGAQETLRKIEESGSEGIIIHVDVSDEEKVESMFKEVLERLGNLDILVNNAAINASGTKIEDMETDHWLKTIRTNLTGY